jgi:adenylosuccinate synthase
MLKRGAFNIIMGAQAGSEAKGKASALISEISQPSAFFMAASPNAGHTAVIDGKKYVTYHLPVGGLMGEDRTPIILGATSLITPNIFVEELSKCGINARRVFIDRRALCISPEMIDKEKLSGFSNFGSTLQGVGAARMAKLGRKVGREDLCMYSPELLSIPGLNLGCDTSAMLNDIMDGGGAVLAEMTQGFDLCLEHGIHRNFCTSKMIHPAGYMAEAGVSPKRIGYIIGVLRTFPIRVNNRTGSSGPYPGAEEITWEKVAAECGYPGKWEDLAEYTTTTHLLRRVFTFSWERFIKFVNVCRPDALFLQFANYLDWDEYKKKGRVDELGVKARTFISELEKAGSVPVQWVGTGPAHEDVVM